MTWAVLILEVWKALKPILGPLLEQWLLNRFERIADDLGPVSADPAEFKAQLERIFAPDQHGHIHRPRQRRLAVAIGRVVMSHADEVFAHVKPMLSHPPLHLEVRADEAKEVQYAGRESDE